MPGLTDPAGGLTHRSGARPQTDKGRRGAHSSAGASGPNYNSQEAPREPARRVSGLGRPGFSEHCGKRSSAARSAARALEGLHRREVHRRIPFGLKEEAPCPLTQTQPLRLARPGIAASGSRLLGQEIGNPGFLQGFVEGNKVLAGAGGEESWVLRGYELSLCMSED